MEEKLKRFDKIIVGILAGIVLTLIGYILSYYVLQHNLPDFESYMNYSIRGNDRQTILIFSLLPNMFFFYLTNFRWQLNQMTKGLVGLTLILGLVLVLFTVL